MNFKNKYKILVTGGAGMIGSNLVKKLVHYGFDVFVADNLWRGKKEYLFAGETSMVVTLENHYTESGVGSLYISNMASAGLLHNRKTLNIGIEELPQCGRNDEVLEYHGLTPVQISERILKKFHSE